MASSIKTEAIYITTHHCMVPYTTYVVALKVHVWCTIVFWACRMQAEYTVCVYAPLIIGAGISVDSAPAMQAL